MSFTNPTPLQIGMVGNLAGKRYRVAGRVVMGMEEGGKTYYWNEYHLAGMEGQTATLVYEETDYGGEWRLFTMFEPDQPLTAEEAASKRVGDTLTLKAVPVRVTLVDESRVYQIEGEPPEGVEVGDVAHYFNAESGNTMQVVSWTGQEVEFFRGLNLPRGAVATAFGLPRELPTSLLAPEPASSGSSSLVVKIAGVIVGLAIVLAAYLSCKPTRQPATLARTKAPTAPLAVGTSGSLEGVTYHVRGHVLVEIAQVGRIYERHEYDLFDDDGNRVLLICGLKPESKEWCLFTPLELIEPLTATEAASRRVGEMIVLGSYVAPLTEIFQSTIRQAEPEKSDSPGRKVGDVFYGFIAQSRSTLLLAKWNENGIAFHAGRIRPAKQVTAAFGQKARQ